MCSLSLVIRHANRNSSLPHSSVICGLSGCTIFFSYCIINGTISGELLNLKCVYSSTGFVVNEVSLVQDFIRVRPSSTVIIIAPLLHTRYCDQKDKGSKPGNLPERNVLSEIVGHFFTLQGLNILYCIPTNIVLCRTPFATLPVYTVSKFNKGIRDRYKPWSMMRVMVFFKH